VGKPLGSHVISKRGSVQKLVNEHTLQDLVDALRRLGFSDASRPRYEGAVYILERERVEESWRSNGNVGRGSLRPCAPDVKLSRQVLRLLERCWDGDASKRPTAVEFNREWSSITVLVED
jgi:hypothetical protein